MNQPRPSIKERLLDKLLYGCIFTLFGAGIYVALAMFGLVIDEVNADMFIGLSFVAVPSLGVGLAFLINYFVGRKVLKQEIEAEARNQA
jgi:phosphate/sulfate permease